MSNDEIAQKWASPSGLGSFAPPSALLVAYRPIGLLASHALNLDKIPQANVKVFAGHHTKEQIPKSQPEYGFRSRKKGWVGKQKTPD